MNALFRGGPELITRSRDGLNSSIYAFKEIEVLNDDGTTTRYGMEPSGGGDTDGASVPWVGQAISHLLGLNLDPYGDYWPGAVVHDLIFRRRLVQWIDGAWKKLTYVKAGADPAKGEMDFDRANAIFQALMFGLGTDETRRTVIYDALAIFGRRAWNDDAATSGTD